MTEAVTTVITNIMGHDAGRGVSFPQMHVTEYIGPIVYQCGDKAVEKFLKSDIKNINFHCLEIASCYAKWVKITHMCLI